MAGQFWHLSRDWALPTFVSDGPFSEGSKTSVIEDLKLSSSW
jgi:hypothetical protein